MSVYGEKAQQVHALMEACDLDLWLVMVRETAEHTDPVLKLFGHERSIWPALFLFGRGGERIAICGRGDDEAVRAMGLFDPVLAYTQSFRQPLLDVVTGLNPRAIGINFSRDDVSADGLTYGLYLNLCDALRDTPYVDRLVSAEELVEALRMRKTPAEQALMRRAIRAAMEIIETTTGWLRVGLTEREIFHFVQDEVRRRGLDFGWPAGGCPSLNAGPDSPWGHVAASGEKTAAGQTLHMDFGVKVEGYGSDNQRMWYFLPPGESEPPAELAHAFDAVAEAIQRAADFVRPGVLGWEVDAVARELITGAGYPEYPHALGHSVGRHSHDGGTGFYPRWERYGKKPYGRIPVDAILTLELGVHTPFGYVGLEEEILVTQDGCEWLWPPQKSLILVPS